MQVTYLLLFFYIPTDPCSSKFSQKPTNIPARIQKLNIHIEISFFRHKPQAKNERFKKSFNFRHKSPVSAPYRSQSKGGQGRFGPYKKEHSLSELKVIGLPIIG